MKGSGIGGQAVMEGVMMKNGDKYAVAVRKPDNEIVVDVQEHKALGSKYGLNKIPLLRGVIAFIDSLTLGVSTLTFSASFFEDDDEAEKKKALEAMDDESRKAAEKKQARIEKLAMTGTVCLSVVLAIGIFMLLPYYISRLLSKVVESAALLAFLEGVLRVALFVGYVAAISLMNDIKRVFMYHGAEHKSINCIEHGLELTVDNVRAQSREHKRCGTSFLLIVMLISVLFFMFIQAESAWGRVLLRLVLIPVIAGISYEFIRLAGRTDDNKLVNALSKPGMWLQQLTTREPDDSMIECAIASVEAVFDWKDFLAKYDEPGDCKTGACADIAQTTATEKVAKTDKKAVKSEKAEAKTEKAVSAEKTAKAETGPAKTEKAVSAEKTAKTETKPAKTETKPAKSETKSAKVDIKPEINLTKPEPVSDVEDDEILNALDQYFVLKQKKDEQQ